MSLYCFSYGDEDEASHNELARKAYERLKSLSQGLTAQQATKASGKLSRWANPTYAQWSDINKKITKDMIKAI